jgi:hypothetical protein
LSQGGIIMISVRDCAKIAGLHSNELILGVEATERHKRLLNAYLFNMRHGARFVCRLIVGDIRRCLELGALDRAADLLIVLRIFMSGRGRHRRQETRRKAELRAHSRVTKTALAHARRWSRPEYAV